MLGVATVVLSATLAAACGGGTPTQLMGFDAASPPVDPPLLTAVSAGATLTVAVWTRPSPLRKGTAQVLYRVVDSAGSGADGLEFTVLPWMPAHGHGAAAPAPVTPHGDGWYLVAPVLFYMSGRWELRTTFHGVLGDSSSDQVAPVLDVP